MQNPTRPCRRTFALAAAIGALSALAYPPAWAQAPNPHAGKPLRVVLPVGPGSGVDTIIRAAGPALSKSLGQPVVIENVTGAGGIIGTTAIVKAAPDGSPWAWCRTTTYQSRVYKRCPSMPSPT